MKLSDDCLALTLRYAPPWRVAMACTAGARVVRVEAVAIARATSSERRLACHAAARGDEATLDALGWADETVARVAAAHHQWSVLEWCGRHVVGRVDRRVAEYAHAHGHGASLPSAWGPPVRVESLPRWRGPPQELQAAFPEMHVLISSQSEWRYKASERMHCTYVEPRTLSIDADWLSQDGSSRVSPACDVVTDLKPLGPGYSVVLRFRGRETTGAALCALGFSNYKLVFKFDDSGPPERFGCTYDAWILTSNDRARVSTASSCCGILLADGGLRTLDLGNPEEINGARAVLLKDI